MTVPASYEKQVMKLNVNDTSVTLTFTESAVYALNPYWVDTESGSHGVWYTVKGERIREETFYTFANIETSASTFMRSFKSGDRITIGSFTATTVIKYILIWKVGNYVENN